MPGAKFRLKSEKGNNESKNAVRQTATMGHETVELNQARILPDPDKRVTLHNTTPLSVESQQPGIVGAHPSGDTGRTNESEPVTDATPKRIQLSYTPNNVESFNRLKDRSVDVLKRAGHATTSVPLHAYFKKRIPIEGVGHQKYAPRDTRR